MKPQIVEPCSFTEGEIDLLGDKSIAHRAAIVSAISCGKTAIQNFPPNKDCLCTINVLKNLGIKIKIEPAGNLTKTVTVFGRGLGRIKKPKQPLFAGESGTTLRLILGVLAGQNFKSTLTAGRFLSNRPMLRVTAPLRKMGAQIKAKREAQNAKPEEYPPITIKGGKLKAITYKMPVASAQVKSALIFAGLYAKGTTVVIEPIKTRDHTEQMLKYFGADIKLLGNKVVIKGNRKLFSPSNICIPGDISSASFFMILASIIPYSRILLKSVGLNPLRSGIIRVLKRMGADIRISVFGSRLPAAQAGFSEFEPMGDLIVRSSQLKGVTVKSKEIPSIIDELPILMVAACFAKGKSIFEGVGELRVKETDRIKSMVENLVKMGAKIKVARTAQSEKIIISGVKKLKGSNVKSFSDHRTAMSMLIAGLAAEGKSRIDDIGCINKSYPNFLTTLEGIIR